MSEQAVRPPLSAAPDPDGKNGGGDGDGVMGRVLDVAGICAGVVLAVIVADILAKGRISRWLLRRKACEDCDDQAQAVPGDG